MDTSEFLTQFLDRLAPTLDTYEQAIYLYCVRHSRLIGEPEAVIGFKSARHRIASGTGKAGSALSENSCYTRLRTLEQKGCIQVLGTERGGTRIRVALPAEIPGLELKGAETTPPSLEELDFFNVETNRGLILVREDHRCFYCLREINSENYVIEHVVSRPEGDNSYRNLVAACRQCNNRKGTGGAEDFLRVLYREGLLSSDDFVERKSKLDALRDGRLRPSAP